MKYRHSYHAGNFADVHKHVALLALIAALKRKDKGFLFLDTHAGRGAYDLSGGGAEADGGVRRLLVATPAAAELRDYLGLIGTLRTALRQRHLYPGSPLLAAAALRPQDRGGFIELQGAEAHALKEALTTLGTGEREMPKSLRVERGEGFAALRAWLPPAERRGLILLDPPYEETQADFAALSEALAAALGRFATGVLMAWYPIKDERSLAPWLAQLAGTLPAPLLASELWLYPRDSRVGLNGSGLLIVNPPYRTLERMQEWLPELTALLAVGPAAGSSARMLSQSPR
jgi:23S rRNA (adenine2030-N6)-methyltransferase